jgi:hypothetical protein
LRKLIVTMLATAVVLTPMAALATPKPVQGHFVKGTVAHPAGQPHRVYFKVAAKPDDNQCSVTLHGRTQQVDLGVGGVSSLTNMFFLRKSGATDAYNQAIATNYEPTPRVICTH